MTIKQVIRAMLLKQPVWFNAYGKCFKDKIVNMAINYKGHATATTYGFMLQMKDHIANIAFDIKDLYLTEEECWQNIPKDKKDSEYAKEREGKCTPKK